MEFRHLDLKPIPLQGIHGDRNLERLIWPDAVPGGRYTRRSDFRMDVPPIFAGSVKPYYADKEEKKDDNCDLGIFARGQDGKEVAICAPGQAV
jgi:hypothetical protein